MRSCKAAVLPRAANRLLDYLLLNSNSNTFTSVTNFPAFLNSHFYLSHHLRIPSAVYLKYIQPSSMFLWDVLKFHFGRTLFFILFYFWLVYLEMRLCMVQGTRGFCCNVSSRVFQTEKMLLCLSCWSLFLLAAMKGWFTGIKPLLKCEFLTCDIASAQPRSKIHGAVTMHFLQKTLTCPQEHFAIHFPRRW